MRVEAYQYQSVIRHCRSDDSANSRTVSLCEKGDTDSKERGKLERRNGSRVSVLFVQAREILSLRSIVIVGSGELK